MILVDFIKRFFEKKTKKLNNKFLPSQGFFYSDDFEITIKKVDIKEVIEYGNGYDREDLGIVLGKLKKIVENNISLSKGYTFLDIKSIDVVFIFLEIVSFTKGKPITLEYFNDEIGMVDKINFNENTFNYFHFEEELMECWDSKDKCFAINGYRFTLPSIGLENALTGYLMKKASEPDSAKYNSYNYNFTYFLGNKKNVRFEEIENLIQIFNFDMEEEEVEKTDEVVIIFIPLQKYSLIKNNKVIEISSKINLQRIWE
jgi:hypothetical protein